MSGTSIPTRPAPIPGITKPLQVPTKTIRSSSDIHNEPNTPEKFTTQDNSSGVTSHQFHFQNTANLPFSQFRRTQRNIPIYNPFADFINQIQNNQAVAYQPIRSNDQTFMLNTKTTTVPTLSRPPLAPLNIADTYSLSTTNNNPFETNTILNATANQSQTLYQPHTHCT